MKKALVLLAIVSLSSASFVGRPVAKTAQRADEPEAKIWTTGNHNAGLLRLLISNYGRHGYENQGEWPVGSGDIYIFGAGIWVGCIALNDTLVTAGYDPSNGTSEFVPGDLPNESGYTDPHDRIFWSDDPGDMAEWPVVVNGDTVVVSSQDSWCQFNDLDTSRHAVDDTQPIGVRITQTGYSWDYLVYQDFIFLVYQVENISGEDLAGVYVGVACDADVGNADNDMVGFDSLRNLGYAYTQQPAGSDVSGYIGYDFLESPLDSMGEQLGLTAFKIFTRESVPPDPGTDVQRYLVLGGYNYQTGQFMPFDADSVPSDKRFIQCTGPFDMAVGDTARVVVAILAGADLAELQLNADIAQNLYDHHFETHQVSVVSPNGGEVLSGTTTVHWTAESATSETLTVDLYCSRNLGENWMVIATEQPDDGVHEWITTEFLDGTNYLIRVVATDGVLVGEDKSDQPFTVNNPGNGPPDVLLLWPNIGEITGTVDVLWEADDADGDALSMGLYYSPDGEEWNLIVQGEPNDGVYSWDTYPLFDGSYLVKITASDADTTMEDISNRYLTVRNDHALIDHVLHTKGSCNTVTILPYEFVAEELTGHDYEMRFNLIQIIDWDTPVYTYDLYDVTADSLLLEEQPVDVQLDGQLYTTWSPLVHGMALKMDVYIEENSFNFVSFQMIVDNGGCDAVLVTPSAPFSAPFRGSDYEIRWQEALGGSLTAQIWDLDNDVEVPYAPQIGDCWAFFRSAVDFSKNYRQGHDKAIYLCGGIFYFDQALTMAVPPTPGDVWTVTAAGDRVPCHGNVYRFGPGTEVEPSEDSPARPEVCELSQNYPNPFNSCTEIAYLLPTGDARLRTTLRIYNILGQVVRTVVDEPQSPGYHRVVWDARDDMGSSASSGVYLARLRHGNLVQTRKIVLVK